MPSQTCRKYSLDRPSETYQPNAWEFLINKQHNLVWCNVFKAASSTWFYNFNLLAGYTEYELLHTKESPVNLARKRYSRCVLQQWWLGGWGAALSLDLSVLVCMRELVFLRSYIIIIIHFPSLVSFSLQSETFNDWSPTVSMNHCLLTNTQSSQVFHT